MRNLNTDTLTRLYSADSDQNKEIIDQEENGMCVFITEIKKSLKSERAKYLEKRNAF